MTTAKFEVHAIEETEIEKLAQWNHKHIKTCKQETRWLKFSVSSGIGQNIYIKCACGEQVDITDYALW